MFHRITSMYAHRRASLMAQMVKNPPAMQETQIQSLDWEDPLEKEPATHSSILAWRIPWTVVLWAPLSMGFSGKNTGVDCHFLLQGIFLTQGLNLGLLHCRQTLYHLSHQGSPPMCIH